MKGIAICVSCACHTRAKEASSRMSSPSGNGSSADTGISEHRIGLEELQPFARQSRPPRQRPGECGGIEWKNLGPVAAQAGQRAGIAFPLGGGELGFIAVAKPEFGLKIGGLAQRRRGRDLFDGPPARSRRLPASATAAFTSEAVSSPSGCRHNAARFG